MISCIQIQRSSLAPVLNIMKKNSMILLLSTSYKIKIKNRICATKTMSKRAFMFFKEDTQSKLKIKK